MIEKRETCLYCGNKMKSKSAKRKFCSDLHRLYYNRELKRGTLSLPHVGESKPAIFHKGITLLTPGSSITDINTGEVVRNDTKKIMTIKPPRLPNESGIDYSIRLAEWKNK